MTEHVRAQLAAAAAKGQKGTSTPRTPPLPADSPAAPVAGVQGQAIEFPGKVPGLNGSGGLLRMHWRARLSLELNYLKRVYAAGLRRMRGPVRLELVRYSTGRQMDYDNLVSTGKLAIDALVKAQILPDDNPAIITERSYTQQRAASKEAQRTVIRLIDL